MALYSFLCQRESDLPLFAARLQSSSVDGLAMDSFRAQYIVQYRNNLIGRHFKALMQLTVFHVHGIVSDNLFALVKSVGSLGAVLWVTDIEDIEAYLVSYSTVMYTN